MPGDMRRRIRRTGCDKRETGIGGSSSTLNRRLSFFSRSRLSRGALKDELLPICWSERGKWEGKALRDRTESAPLAAKWSAKCFFEINGKSIDVHRYEYLYSLYT